MLNTPVLILNQNYQPLNVCNTRRALVLLNLGKAELMQDSAGQINTVSKVFNIPSIIRLYRMVKIPLHSRRLSRIGVFVRDNHTCQYCGTYSKTRMKLIKEPSPPRPNPFYLVERSAILSEWQPFIPWLVPQASE